MIEESEEAGFFARSVVSPHRPVGVVSKLAGRFARYNETP